MSEDVEIWKFIDGFEGYYEISNLGRFRSNERTIQTKSGNVVNIRGGLVTPHVIYSGYHRVTLSKNGYSTNTSIHRLVATAFITNQENKPQVNHIDGDKSNNHYSNLEWCTNSENMRHAFDSGLCVPNTKGKLGALNKLSKSIDMLALDGAFVRNFGSISEASRITGLNLGNISRCCSGGLTQTCGYIFKYSKNT